jgi:hypothetical protein
MFNFLQVSAKYTFKDNFFGPLESIQANFGTIHMNQVITLLAFMNTSTNL